MANVVVKPVRSWLDRRRFLHLPWTLYEQDPHWIPPLLQNQRELLNYSRHAFFKTAEIQTFLAYRDGQLSGRIAAIVNHEHERRYHDGCGFFGFFESVNDRAVSDALFNTAWQWLRERGCKKLRGPANPSMNYECGTLVDGFDSGPTFMMTYNPLYHSELIEGYGFRKGHDMYAYEATREEIPSNDPKIERAAEQAIQFCNATLRTMTRKTFNQDVDTFIDLYNRSLVVNWGFVPLTPAEMKSLATSLKFLLIPEMTVFAFVDGKSVGAVVGLPDYNPRIKEINGRLLPFGVFRLLSKKHDIRRVRVVSINVVPEYQRWGLGLALLKSLVPKAHAMGFVEAEFSWISEDNELARRGLEKAGMRLTKTFRMYDYEPSASGV